MGIMFSCLFTCVIMVFLELSRKEYAFLLACCKLSTFFEEFN